MKIRLLQRQEKKFTQLQTPRPKNSPKSPDFMDDPREKEQRPKKASSDGKKGC